MCKESKFRHCWSHAWELRHLSLHRWDQGSSQPGAHKAQQCPSLSLCLYLFKLSSPPQSQQSQHSRTPYKNTKTKLKFTTMLIGFDVLICRNTQRSHKTRAEPPCIFPDPQRWQWHLLAATAWTETLRSSCPWKLNPAQTRAGCFRAFFFFLIFMWNYPKRLENGNIDILIQQSLTSILQPIQHIGIQDALFESLLNFPLSDWAHSLPLLFSVRLKFLSGVVLGTTWGNKITPVWMLCSQGTFPVIPA